MKRARIIVITFLLLTAILCGAIALLHTTFAVKLFMIQAVSTTLLLTTAAIVFLLARKGFRKHLRIAYVFFCLALLWTVFGLVQAIVLAVFNAGETRYALYVGTDWPFYLMTIFAYFGIRTLARQAQAESKILLQPWFPFVAATIISLLVLLLPTTRTDHSKGVVYIAAFDLAFCGVVLTCATVLTYRTMRQLSVLYKSALRWQTAYYGTTSFVFILNTFASLYVSTSSWYWNEGVGFSIYAFSSALAVVAAFAFTRIAYAEQVAAQSDHKSAGNSIGIVTWAAQFASNPVAIDPILDDLRQLTAAESATHEQRLTDEQQQRTARIYLAIEDYLINKEPVRKFKPDELRETLEIRFKHSVPEATFWQEIESHPAAIQATTELG